MGKNIAIFADGTGNTVGNHETNVLRLCRMADIRNPHEQLVIYDPGVGTRAASKNIAMWAGRPAKYRRLTSGRQDCRSLHRAELL